MVMMDDKKKKLVERVLKLFSLGDKSRNQSEAETEAAATKAKQLMMEYQLSEIDLETYGSKKSAQVAWIIKEYGAYTLKRPFALYDDYVGVAVDAICGTRHIVRTSYANGKKFYTRVFIGTEADIAVAGELFLILLDTLRRSARQRFGGGWTTNHAQYGIGFSTRLALRAREHVPAQVGAGNVFALVLRDKNAAVEGHLSGMNLSKAKPKKVTHSEAFFRGYADGEKVDLSNPRRKLAG